MSISRRSFMFLGAAAAVSSPVAKGGACSAPLCNHANAEAVPLGGPLTAANSPLLKLVKFTPLKIDVGAKKPFKVIHCSDTHLNFMSVGDLLGAKVAGDLKMYEGRRSQHNTLAPFAACVLKARLEGVSLLHTGDVWDYDSVANGLLAEDAFRQVGDVFYAMGNHEQRGHWESDPDFNMAKSRESIQRYLPNSIVYASKVIGGINFVSFDDTGHSFDLQAEMESGVKAEFAKGLPVVLMVHEPFKTDELFSDLAEAKGQLSKHKKMPKNNVSAYMYGARSHERKFIDWMLAQPNLKAVLCGHLHHEAQYKLSDTVTQYIAGAAMKGFAYEITFA